MTSSCLLKKPRSLHLVFLFLWQNTPVISNSYLHFFQNVSQQFLLHPSTSYHHFLPIFWKNLLPISLLLPFSSPTFQSILNEKPEWSQKNLLDLYSTLPKSLELMITVLPLKLNVEIFNMICKTMSDLMPGSLTDLIYHNTSLQSSFIPPP